MILKHPSMKLMGSSAIMRAIRIFLEDRRTVYAVERKLEIIGECVLRIMRKDPFIQIENARRIVQFRNRIAHEYDRIDYTIMWSILKNHLPLLKQDVLLLLDKLDDSNVR